MIPHNKLPLTQHFCRKRVVLIRVLVYFNNGELDLIVIRIQIQNQDYSIAQSSHY